MLRPRGAEELAHDEHRRLNVHPGDRGERVSPRREKRSGRCGGGVVHEHAHASTGARLGDPPRSVPFGEVERQRANSARRRSLSGAGVCSPAAALVRTAAAVGARRVTVVLAPQFLGKSLERSHAPRYQQQIESLGREPSRERRADPFTRARNNGERVVPLDEAESRHLRPSPPGRSWPRSATGRALS